MYSTKRLLACFAIVFLIGLWLQDSFLSITDSTRAEKPAPIVFDANDEFIDVQNKSRDCLVVFHVPKSAGSSMVRVLEQAAFYKHWEFIEWYNVGRAGSDPSPIHNTTKIVHTGHISPTFLTLTHTRHCYRMTLLRDPVSRVNSMYHYHHQMKLLSPNTTWETIYEGENCRFCPFYFNSMTRMFSTTITWNMQFHKLATRPTIDENNLKRAKSFLSTMDLICFFPDFDLCLKKLHNAIQTEILPFPKVNEGQAKKPVTETILNMIRAANTMDIELYEWARRNFSPS